MAEQRWVTINGHHVLINDDGTPVNEKDKKLLAGKNKQVQKKAWKDMTHQERVAEMQKDGERYAKDPTIADKEKWSADYKKEVIDYARPIMAEKRRSATIKNPASKNKSLRKNASRKTISAMETRDLEKTYMEGVKNGQYKRPSDQIKYDSTEWKILVELGGRGREYNEHMGKFIKGKSTGRGHVRKYNR